jgi:hypothetical protein
MGTRIVEVDENIFSSYFNLSAVRVVSETDGDFTLHLCCLFLYEFYGQRYITEKF